MASYLLVIGDREALGWVLSEQRMAFPGFQRGEVRAFAPDDTLLLYTARGCFKNPTRDRGRIIAAGTATTAVSTLDGPVEVGGRSFPVRYATHSQVLGDLSNLLVEPALLSFATREHCGEAGGRAMR